VVASAVGGIPEVVDDGVTGLLVPYDAGPHGAEAFARDLAAALNRVAGDPELARKYGEAGRQAVIDRFSWRGVAEQTATLYRSLVG
jgi:starch synthase